MLTQEAEILPWLRYAEGEDLYGPAQTRPCRLQRRRQEKVVYKNPDGTIDETVAHATMFCEGEPIPPRSRVTVEGEEFIVLNCYQARGFGPHHLEVTLE